MNRCIDGAKKQSIERSLCLAVDGQEMWEGAAVLWALLKARKKLSFNALEDIEYDLCEAIPKLEDKLSAFASFLVAGGNLRQDKTTFSCSHPRVEAGLAQSMLEKPNAASRTLNTLLAVLVELDEYNHTDWGVETAAQIFRSVSSDRWFTDQD